LYARGLEVRTSKAPEKKAPEGKLPGLWLVRASGRPFWVGTDRMNEEDGTSSPHLFLYYQIYDDNERKRNVLDYPLRPWPGTGEEG